VLDDATKNRTAENNNIEENAQVFMEGITKFEKDADAWKKIRTSKKLKDCFIVEHYAGPVTYTVHEWVEKNADKLPPDVYRCLEESKSSFVSEICQALNPESMLSSARSNRGPPGPMSPKSPSKKSTTIAAGFKGKLGSLAMTLKQCSCHFVRCIKTNMRKEKDVFEEDLVLSQLAYTGMLATLNIRRQGYPLRLSKEEFLEKYSFLAGTEDVTLALLLDKINKLVPELLLQRKGHLELYLKRHPLVEGKTMVLGREWLASELTELRAKFQKEEARREAEKRLRAEEEARRKAEEEARLRAEEKARLKADESTAPKTSSVEGEDGAVEADSASTSGLQLGETVQDNRMPDTDFALSRMRTKKKKRDLHLSVGIEVASSHNVTKYIDKKSYDSLVGQLFKRYDLNRCGALTSAMDLEQLTTNLAYQLSVMKGVTIPPEDVQQAVNALVNDNPALCLKGFQQWFTTSILEPAGYVVATTPVISDAQFMKEKNCELQQLQEALLTSARSRRKEIKKQVEALDAEIKALSAAFVRPSVIPCPPIQSEAEPVSCEPASLPSEAEPGTVQQLLKKVDQLEKMCERQERDIRSLKGVIKDLSDENMTLKVQLALA